MATYVTSDAHGHLRALDRALELAAPGASDQIYVLGDMIDRGPDPLGVIRLVRGLPNAHVMMGNHERLMLDALLGDDPALAGGWEMNGGWSTSGQLDGLASEGLSEVIDWAATLPLFDIVKVEDRFAAGRYHEGSAPERTYLLCHAGIDALAARGFLATMGIDLDVPGVAAKIGIEPLVKMMMEQEPLDLLWIREQFWGARTGLVDADGLGPIVVAGHTPTSLLGRFARLMGGPVLDAAERARVVEVGACQDTGGIADRIDIDAGAAGGAPNGQVAVMRLEDHAVWYAPVLEGE